MRSEIQHKVIPKTWVLSRRVQLQDRKALAGMFQDLKQGTPDGAIIGPPFCIYQFVTSISEGHDVELCLPVREGTALARLLPGMDVLSLRHRGPLEELSESYRILYTWAADQGIISDEFCLEAYPDVEKSEVEIQFVIHPWEQLLERHLDHVLGPEKVLKIIPAGEKIQITSSLADRFDWVQTALANLEKSAGEDQCYQVLSGCSHVFPPSQIAKLREVYLSVEARTGDRLAAVDAVLDFMGEDPGWGDRPSRSGARIYTTKNPRDPAAYEKAETPQEKKIAYCYCPLVRENLAGGMPEIFCNCGAGWYRQQWEGALGQPVQVEIIHSLLNGDDYCEFAVLLPEKP